MLIVLKEIVDCSVGFPLEELLEQPLVIELDGLRRDGGRGARGRHDRLFPDSFFSCECRFRPRYNLRLKKLEQYA
jgi:hypothetical protein